MAYDAKDEDDIEYYMSEGNNLDEIYTKICQDMDKYSKINEDVLDEAEEIDFNNKISALLDLADNAIEEYQLFLDI